MSIGGQPRNFIAALDAATGLATAWNPNPNERIYSLAVSRGTVYAAGNFERSETRRKATWLPSTRPARHSIAPTQLRSPRRSWLTDIGSCRSASPA